MAEQSARRSYENKAIDALIEASTVEFPAIIAEKELDRLIAAQENELQASKISLEDYLRSQNKSREELREDLRPIATKNISGSLALGKLAEEEKFEVAAEEIDEEIEIMVQNAGEQGENMRKLFQSPGTRKSLENVIITRKTVQRLVQIASGEAETEAAETEPQAEQTEPASSEAQPEAAEDESKSGDSDTT
jgi:trigger factor